jgi:hypothetical protein
MQEEKLKLKVSREKDLLLKYILESKIGQTII